MSLFSSINVSAAALRASQLGLQVVGHNIANANTPGYIRQELELVPASATRIGRLVIGQGVLPYATRQIIDQSLAERMWRASSAVAGGQALDQAYQELESIVGGLNGSGLGHQLNLWNEALHELANAPANPSSRDLVLMQSQALVGAIQQSYSEVLESVQRTDAALPAMAENINVILERIAKLNLEIMVLEGGRKLGSDATGLREERYNLIEQFARMVDINVQEQANGSVTIFVGGDYMVADTSYRQVYMALNRETGGREIRIQETDSPLMAKGGTIGATQAARDEVFGSYLRQLDQFAADLAKVVNQVHSQGQGLRGLTSTVGATVVQAGVPLVHAELDFVPNNGSFDLQIVDEHGAAVSTHRIAVQRLGIVGDSTVDSIVSDINAIDGISARINGRGQVEIVSDLPGIGFTFQDDTSGFLAAAGLNTFFTGNTALGLAVNPVLLENPELLAVSRHGIRNDTDTLAELVDLIQRPLATLNGQSLQSSHQQMINRIAQNISLNRSATSGAEDFYNTLRSQHLSITGVNLDEEAIRMIMYQRAFQASSRVIATASEMLELLVAL